MRMKVRPWEARVFPVTRSFLINRRGLLAFLAAIPFAIGLPVAALAQATDPLPSWNDGTAKQAIVEFIAKVTTEGGPDFVPLEGRIATFDNDGTLWVEHPIYTQFAFALDRLKKLAPQHPEWSTTQPFQAALSGDTKALAAAGEKGAAELIMATHAGMTTDEFETIVTDWLATARHPRFDRPYTKLVYQPMLEVLDYLRANGFTTYIVSGGGIEFMRPWTRADLRHSAGQVVGSSIKTQFEMRDGTPVLFRLPQIDFVDDMVPASRSASSSISAAGQSPHSAIRMAIFRCCSGRR